MNEVLLTFPIIWELTSTKVPLQPLWIKMGSSLSSVSIRKIGAFSFSHLNSNGQFANWNFKEYLSTLLSFSRNFIIPSVALFRNLKGDLFNCLLADRMFGMKTTHKNSIWVTKNSRWPRMSLESSRNGKSLGCYRKLLFCIPSVSLIIPIDDRWIRSHSNHSIVLDRKINKREDIFFVLIM